ncbi:hypothetical protein DMENIID0001_024440 [Sergentomyia squamirostris]
MGRRKEKPLEKSDFWDENRTLNLISKFQAVPILWDPSHKQYRNKALKAEAFEGLAYGLALSKREVQRKLHNLRTQFNTELRKQNKPGNRNKSSSWKYFDVMKFVAVSNPNQTKIEISESDSESELSIKTDENTMRSFEVISDFQSGKSNSKITPRTERDQETLVQITSFEDESTRVFRKQSIDEDHSRSKNVLTLEPIRDDHQIFADFVASELRSLGSDYKRKKLRLAIQRAIIDVNELP